jgi:putative two-component system response regulator
MEAQRPGDILVIEKDIHFLTEICNALRNARHNVVSCTSAEEGHEHLERIPFDVVLCAESLPDGSGCEVCHFIKKTPELQQTSCAVFLDEEDYESHQQQIVASTYNQGNLPHCEADDFLSRRVSTSELILRVRTLIRMRRYLEEINRATSTLMSVAEGAEEQNPHYKGHCKRLANMAVELGLVLGCDEWELGVLEKAGYLHDIGLICIPGAILEKAQPLSPREMQIIQQHCVLGEKLCRPVAALRGVLPVIRHHHERLNGSGYPDNLAGDDVPRLAQIFAVVDVYEGMRLWRPYRPSMSEMQAIKMLAEEVDNGLWNREIFEAFRDKVLPGLDARLKSTQIFWPAGGTLSSL